MIFHEPTNECCLVYHVGPHGEPLPQCVKCARCGHWIRPNELRTECPGKTRTWPPNHMSAHWGRIATERLKYLGEVSDIYYTAWFLRDQIVEAHLA